MRMGTSLGHSVPGIAQDPKSRKWQGPCYLLNELQPLRRQEVGIEGILIDNAVKHLLLRVPWEWALQGIGAQQVAQVPPHTHTPFQLGGPSSSIVVLTSPTSISYRSTPRPHQSTALV